MTASRHTVVFLNGIAGAGKDTFVDLCCDRRNGVVVHNHSSINCVRELLGINVHDKRPETRKVLAEVGASLEAYNGFRSKRTAHDIFTVMARNRHVSEAKHLHFVHVREATMATAIATQLDGQIPNSLLDRTKIVRMFVVAPPHVVRVLNNASDIASEYGFSDGTTNNYGADFVVNNNGPLDALPCEVERFLDYNEALHAPAA